MGLKGRRSDCRLTLRITLVTVTKRGVVDSRREELGGLASEILGRSLNSESQLHLSKEGWD